MNIVYAMPYKFPCSSPGARRILGISQSLAAAGHQVIIGSGAQTESGGYEIQEECPPIASVTHLNEGTSNNGVIMKTKNYFGYGKKTVQWLKELNPVPDLIIQYASYLPYALRIQQYCQQNSIPLVIDIVEWYQPSHEKLGYLNPKVIGYEIAMRRVFHRSGNIIPISRYLEQYFSSRDCKTLRIPPTLDVEASEVNLDPPAEKPMTIAYTGTPGKKDIIDVVISAILRFDPEGERIRFKIAGPSVKDVLNYPSMKRHNLKFLPKCLEVLGYVTNEMAMNTVRHADFSVLLRPRHRYAMAGFPTKVAESLAVGTPVICNLTSDLGEYIHDGQEGLICLEPTEDAFLICLDKAVNLTVEERKAMRLCAREQAINVFDYRRYIMSLDGFVNDVIIKNN